MNRVLLGAPLALTLLACSGPPPGPWAELEPDIFRQQRAGAFDVNFQLRTADRPRDAAGALKPLFIFGRVEHRPGDVLERGRIVGEASTVELAADARIQFGQVENGDDRVVVVELRESRNADYPVLLYGISEKFRLRPGEQTRPKVLVSIVPRPSAGAARGPERVDSPLVSLDLRPDGAAIAELSSSPDFPADERTRRARVDHLVHPAPADGFTHQWVDWNLDVDGAPCAGAAGCIRDVYIRYLDAFGYASPPLNVRVVLDTTAPTLLLQADNGAPLTRLEPALARGDSEVRIVLVADEPVRCPEEIAVSETAARFQRVFPVDDDPPGTTCTYRNAFEPSSLAAVGQDRSEFEIAVSVEDLAGTASDAVTLRMAIDVQAPQFSVGIAPLVQGALRLSDEPEFNTLDLTLTLAQEELVTARVDVVDVTSAVASVPCTQAGAVVHCAADVSSLSEGPLVVLGAVWDEARNLTAVERTGVLDLTPPAVESHALSRRDGFPASSTEANVVVVSSSPLAIGGALSRSVTAAITTEELLAPGGISVIMTANGADAGVMELDAGTARQFTVELSVAEGTSARDVVVSAQLRDLVGNQGTAMLGTIRVDDTAPSPQAVAPLVDSMVLRRLPYGRADGGGALTQLEAPTITPSDDVTMYTVHSAPDSVGGFLARVEPTWSDGGVQFPAHITLGAQDTPRAYVRAWDRAGNPSDAVEVRNGTWTARIGDGTGPHAFEAIRWLSEGEAQPAVFSTSLGGDAGYFVSAADGLEAVIPSLAPDAIVSSRDGPRPTARGAMAYFPGPSGPQVIYVGDGRAAQTWQWTGDHWELLQPSLQPPARLYQGMVHDEARGRLVMYGGSYEAEGPFSACPEGGGTSNDRGICYLDDTWTWDGQQWTRDEIASGESAPSAREKMAMAYDPVQRVVVLFGGIRRVNGTCPSGGGPDCVYRDTWEWNGQRWVEVMGSPVPPARFLHAMAWDPARNAVVMHGGLHPSQSTVGCTQPTEGSSGCVWSDLWTYANGVWAPINNLTGGPGPRYFQSAVTVPSGGVVFYGGRKRVGAGACPNARLGRSGDDCITNELWILDGTGWQAAASTATEGDDAPRNEWGTLTLDTSTNTLLLFFGQLWTLDAATLHRPIWRPTVGSMPAPSGALGVMAAMPSAGRVVAFGGVGTAERDNRWEWNGAWWDAVSQSGGNAPSTRVQGATAYDPETGTVLYQGGASTSCASGSRPYCGDTWMFDGTSWAAFPARSELALRGAAMAPSPSGTAGTMVLFGGERTTGFTSGDTFTWSGSQWTLSATTGPEARKHHAMAYDAAQDAIVLFGGRDDFGDLLADTWLFEAGGWRQVVTANAPEARELHAMAYDPNLQRVVLFGGSVIPCDDSTGAPDAERCLFTSVAFTFNATAETWEPLDLVSEDGRSDGAPEAIAYPQLAYDSARRGLLLHGFPSATWILQTDPESRRPGGVFRFNLAAASVDPQEITEARVHVLHQGCAGGCDGGPGAFTQLEFFDHASGGWRPASCQTSDAASLQALTLRRTDGGIVALDEQGTALGTCTGAEWTGADNVASIRAAPRGTAGVVRIDDGELTLRYQRAP